MKVLLLPPNISYLGRRQQHNCKLPWREAQCFCTYQTIARLRCGQYDPVVSAVYVSVYDQRGNHGNGQAKATKS